MGQSFSTPTLDFSSLNLTFPPSPPPRSVKARKAKRIQRREKVEKKVKKKAEKEAASALPAVSDALPSPTQQTVLAPARSAF